MIARGKPKGTGITVVTLCKYDEYNRKEPDKGEPKGKPGASQGQAGGNNKNEFNKVNKDNEERGKTSSRFSPPSLLQVQSYISEKNYQMNAQSFIDFYESKGWMVGANKMKSWEAAARTWESRDKADRNNGSRNNTNQRTVTADGKVIVGRIGG